MKKISISTILQFIQSKTFELQEDITRIEIDKLDLVSSQNDTLNEAIKLPISNIQSNIDLLLKNKEFEDRQNILNNITKSFREEKKHWISLEIAINIHFKNENSELDLPIGFQDIDLTNAFIYNPIELLIGVFEEEEAYEVCSEIVNIKKFESNKVREKVYSTASL